jgi:hypothetical protein
VLLASCHELHHRSGWAARVASEMSPQTTTYDKHWIPWLAAELSAHRIATQTFIHHALIAITTPVPSPTIMKPRPESMSTPLRR